MTSKELVFLLAVGGVILVYLYGGPSTVPEWEQHPAARTMGAVVGYIGIAIGAIYLLCLLGQRRQKDER